MANEGNRFARDGFPFFAFQANSKTTEYDKNKSDKNRRR